MACSRVYYSCFAKRQNPSGYKEVHFVIQFNDGRPGGGDRGEAPMYVGYIPGRKIKKRIAKCGLNLSEFPSSSSRGAHPVVLLRYSFSIEECFVKYAAIDSLSADVLESLQCPKRKRHRGRISTPRSLHGRFRGVICII